MTELFVPDADTQKRLEEEHIKRVLSKSLVHRQSELDAENAKLRSRIAELEAAIEPFRRVKGITSVYEYVPVEALRDDDVFNFRMNGAEMKTIRAALKG